MTLSPEPFPFRLVHVDETNSTNSYLQSLCNAQLVEEFTTVITDFQTAGRGQRGNSWESEIGKNLLFSFVLFPKFLEARRQFLISQIISLAIKEELDTYTPDISIKWPNDIYWKQKKICGMLIENDLMGKQLSQSIAGIGININQESFFSPAPNPISLLQITQKKYDLFTILKNIMHRIQDYYTLLQQNQVEWIANHYEKALFRKEGLHLYKDVNGIFLARIVQVEAEGRLILEDENQRKRNYMFKEVEYILER
ncbi:biotin--[acetyl-CoA-carboxylase] ligase [Bacteroides sp.]|uniref:biotin--[acetyl-CoA-carboxylase] ligase n=1 Tax=Bacteroides sp. TaxID=29523 RepID=UPI00261276DE|nr:biotin--[acetyl-CoA-carboxylase] ligase [Bacteroides sp.]MDD3039968.1 biotin--[acetyl-CoA-carboxylase] ligase [Bacteroides sp.]